MDIATTTETTRKPPGPAFFLGAMAVYLLVVHGMSLWSADFAERRLELGSHPELPGYTLTLLKWYGVTIGHLVFRHCFVMLVGLYTCMVAVFFVTRQLVHGPIWLGSLAGTCFMAHPVKTEVFFEVIGLYYLLAALLATLSMLAYLRLTARPTPFRFAVALATYAAACFPFTINAPLFGALFLLEFYPVKQEERRWVRLAPFLAITTCANWFHMDTIYATMPQLAPMLAPLLLLLYPIGLLPETVAVLHESPAMAWAWGTLAAIGAILAFAYIKNGPFRVCLLAILLFRFFPGAEPIDFTTLAGGGQLLFPLAMTCVALAGFSRWLMRFEAWGRPAIALTTMLCILLFVLQFQANRAYGSVENQAAPVGAEAAPDV